jgi:hypothetical protein
MTPAQIEEAITTLYKGGPDDRIRGFAGLMSSLMQPEQSDVRARSVRHRLKLQLRRLARRLAEMERCLRERDKRIKLLARRNQFMAGALGACDCFGQLPDCDRCSGTGAPGTYEPASAAFEVLVAPLLRVRPDFIQSHASSGTGSSGASSAIGGTENERDSIPTMDRRDSRS